ncbi:hypothetical protein [Niveibacterium terrae]|uniref:hypothetical protein n=1 Tax=Niveibacterium terrae TaxID=3373598 RepID=UPI003A93B46E
MTDATEIRRPDAELADLEAIRQNLLSRFGTQQDLPAASLIIEAVLEAFRELRDD